MTKIPEGWAESTIPQVAEVLDTKRIPINSDERAARIDGKSQQSLVAYYGATGQVGWIDTHLFDEDLVLLGEDGVSFLDPGKPKAYRVSGKSWVNNHAHVLRARQDALDWRLLEAQLNTLNYTGHVTGSTRLKLTQGAMNKLPILVPPLAEQKRIADKLDTVLTRVDAVNTRLARVAPLLKRFRQSVLAAATSGRLTEDWRIANPSINAQSWLDEVSSKSKTSSRRKPLEPSLADLSKTVQLPETWTVTGLDSLAADKPHALKAGPFGSALKKSMYVSRGYKIYGQEQVIAGDETVGEYFIDDEKFAELKACAVESGDILISLVGTIGRVLVLSPDALPGIINPRLVKLSLHPEVNRSYFSLYLRSPIALSFFEGNSHGGTMDILNLGILRNLPLLIPPPAEQTEIVRRVETLFAFADRLEARLAQAQTAATRLTPALLAKAFRGELVPQDPNDEPAAELLRRLASSPTAPAKRGRAAKAT